MTKEVASEIEQNESVNEPISETAQTSETQTAKPVKKKWRTFRWLWYFFVFLLVLVFTPIIFLFTGKGQRTALEFATQFVDGLTLEQVEGSLQDGLMLKNAQYKMDGIDVRLGLAEIHIGFDCLKAQKACLENLTLKDATINVDTSKLPPSQPKEQTDWGDIRLPLALSFQNLQADNINVRVDEMDIALKHFQSGIQGQEKSLSLRPTQIDGLSLSLAPEAVENRKENVKNAAKAAVKGVDWEALKKQLAKPLLTKMEPIKLPFYFTVEDFKATDIHIEQKVKNRDGSFAKPISIISIPLVAMKGQSDETKVKLETFEIQSDKGNISGNGHLIMSGNYPLNWHLKGTHPELKEYRIPASYADLKLSGELFGKTLLNLQSGGAATFNLSGQVALTEAKTPFNLVLKSDEIRYPFMPEKNVSPLKLQNVVLTLGGNLLNYQLDGGFSSSGMNLPAGQLHLTGKGELTHFELADLAINALDGKANLSGKVDWKNGVEWDSAVKLNGVNTKSLLPEWAAVLSGALHSKGYAGRGVKGNEWAVSVKDMDVNGSLFQKKLQLKGDLSADFTTLLNVQDAKLIYGENVIALKGMLGDRADFSADINAPNLKGLIPKLSAGLKGKVRMQGKLTEPSLDLDLVANNVVYETLKLQHLTAKGRVTTERQIVADLQLGLTKLSTGEIKIDQANAELKGSETNHTLKLTSKGDPVGANLQLTGRFDRQQEIWQGQLSNVAIQSPLGLFQSDKAIQLNYNNKQIRANVSAHCWRNPKIHFCFPQAFQAGEEGKVPFEIKQFDLATVQEYLDKNTKVSGFVNVKGDAAWFKNKSPMVNVELVSNAIKLTQKMDNTTFPLSFVPVKISAKMAENNVRVNADIKLENNGRLTSDILVKDIANKRALSGNINIDKLGLNLIRPLLSGGEMINGDINARLTVGGTAISPLLYGNLNLAGLKAKSNAMPFDITGGGLTMHFNGATSTLKGSVQTPQSTLNLTGDANWQKLDAWHTRVKAQANKFRVDVPGIAKVDVSPNIEVKVTPKELLLGGRIDIPWARIDVQELPESAVSVSGDEVIMEGPKNRKVAYKPPVVATTKNAPQKGQGMAIKGDVSINIGDDVRLEAYGLKTELKGLIKVRQGNKGLGLYGQVNLKNGTFASFGQDLIIRKGVISFTGLPSQPTLDIEAIRNPEAMEDAKVTAGVRVTGLADNLDVKVFANPSMSQEQALSYILTGRGLENSGDAASSNSVAAALIGMSLSKGSKTVGSVGSAFGISDLNVTTAGIGDNTKVVVSGSLTPKFKVKYGVGIFAPLTELTLRYRLAPSLYLQWISSINQAVDLLYRFEFD